MRKKNYKLYLVVPIESLISWQRIGEAFVYEKLLLKIPKLISLPLNGFTELDKLKTILPRFENIRNLVVIEVAQNFSEIDKRFSNSNSIIRKNKIGSIDGFIDYDAIQCIFPLDVSEKSYIYLKSMVPSIEIQRQSFLDDNLSNKLVQWSEQRNARLASKKMLSLLGVPYPGSYFMNDLWKQVLEIVVMNTHPQNSENLKIQSFLYSLFFYSRNSMKSEFRIEDLGFIDDIAKVLIETIPRETIMNMGLDYKETLQTLKNTHRNTPLILLIDELIIHHNKIQNGLKKYYQFDIFIPALVFLKLKSMHLDQVETDEFYAFIMGLHASGCDDELLAVGLVWFSAFYGFVALRPLYCYLKPRAPFFVELRKYQVQLEVENYQPIQRSIQEQLIKNVLVAQPSDKFQLLENNSLDKYIFLHEGKYVFYALINKNGKYEVKEGKGKTYKYSAVSKDELKDKVKLWTDGQIRMKKESSSRKEEKSFKDVQGIL